MNIALKRKKFVLQIRKHNRIAFMQKRKDEIQLTEKVSNNFKQFVCSQSKTIPRICALNFHLLTSQNIHTYLLSTPHSPKLNLYKPQNIFFLSNLTNCLNIIFPQIFYQTIQIASNLTLTLKTNQYLLNTISQSKLTPSARVLQDLKEIFNCYLEFWAVFWKANQSEITIKHYSLLIKTVIQWYNNQELVQYLSPFSIIQFILSYLTVDQYFQFNIHNNNGVIQMYELNHKFATSIIHILDSLISQGFFCIEVVKIISKIVEKPNQCMINLLKRLLDSNLILEILQKGLEAKIPLGYPCITPSKLTFQQSIRLCSFSQLTYQTLSLLLSLSNITKFQIKFFQFKPIEFVQIILDHYRFFVQNNKRQREIKIICMEVLYNIVMLVGQVAENQWGYAFEGCQMVQTQFKHYFQTLLLTPLLQNTFNANSTVIVCFLEFLTVVFALVNSEQFIKKTIIQSCLITKLEQKLRQNIYDELQVDNIINSLIQLLNQSSKLLSTCQLHPIISNLTSSILIDYLTNSQKKYLLELIQQQQIQI